MTINILYLEHHKNIIGGGQISLLQLLKKLDKKKFNPILVCPAKGELSEAAEKFNIKTNFIPLPSIKSMKIILFFHSILKLIKIIKKYKISILHSNSSRSMIYAAIGRIFYKIPIFWHIRITEQDRILDRLLQPFATKIIVTSQAAARRFSWLKNQNKISTIYNGLDLTLFNISVNLNKIREELSLNQKDIVIGTVAKLHPKKGIHILLKAAPLLREKFPKAKFVIVGDASEPNSSYMDQLKLTVQKLGEEENILFTGFRKDIPQLMGLFDIFALPSFQESFGRVLLEAMAAGKPVVASRVGGIPEVVEDGITGILVPPGDDEKLAEAIKQLIFDKYLREDMGTKGRKRIEKHFSIEKNVELNENLYLQVINN